MPESPPIRGRDLGDAQAYTDQRTGEPMVSFPLQQFRHAHLRQVYQREHPAAVRNRAVRAKSREPILGGSGQVSGKFTVEQANQLAAPLHAGVGAPSDRRCVEERVPPRSMSATSAGALNLVDATSYQ